MAETWPTAQIGSCLTKTELRDPRDKPKAEFVYVDVSSVDNSLFKIKSPSVLKGTEAPSRARKVIRAGDVIYATVRPTLKRVAFISPDFDNQICSTGFCVLRTNGAIDSRFLYSWLLTDLITKRVEGTQRGASYPAIRDSDVKKLPVSIPPLPEQRRIAGVLAAVQQAVEQQQRLIALTAELKKSLMRKLFTQGIRGESQKETEIGPIPKSWQMISFGDVLKIAQYGLSVRAGDVGRYPMLRMTNQVDGKIVPGGLKFVDLVENDLRKFRVLPGDVLFNRTNSFDLVGRTAIFDLDGDYVFASYLIRLRMDIERMSPYFLNHLFNWESTQARLKSIATRAVSQSNISATRLKGFCVPLPPADEQAEIIRVIDIVDAKRERHKQFFASLQALFRTLLHQLMTAQIRVDQLDLSELKSLGIEVD